MLGHPSIRDYDNIISKLNNIIIKHFLSLPFTNYFSIFNNNNINMYMIVVNNGFYVIWCDLLLSNPQSSSLMFKSVFLLLLTRGSCIPVHNINVQICFNYNLIYNILSNKWCLNMLGIFISERVKILVPIKSKNYSSLYSNNSS